MLNSGLNEAPDWVSPLGETILSILEERELTLEQFARRIGVAIPVAQKILDGRNSIDSILARQLAEILGASESFWLAREHDYRATIQQPERTSVSTLSELIKQLPTGDMQKFGWINSVQSKSDKIAECLSFFGVSSLAQWQGKYDDAFQKATYRQSSAYSSKNVATTAWLRKGEIETSQEKVSDWSPEILEQQLPNIRRLTWYKSPALFLPKLKSLLAQAGIKFAVVRAPKGCTASGAVRIFQNDTPHIQLSFRYLSDDQFWFTLFHELAHLLLHYDKMPIIENPELAEHQIEEEANNFAAQVIVPYRFQDEFYSLGRSRFPIITFAKKVGVAPGLIVGQLQHRGIIRFNQMQHLKRRFQWTD